MRYTVAAGRGIKWLGVAAKKLGRILWIPPYRHILGWPALTLTLTILAWNWHATSKWDGYRQSAAARGIVLDPVAANGPAIPDAENFASSHGPFARLQGRSGYDLNFNGIFLDYPSLTKGKRMSIEQLYAPVQGPIPFIPNRKHHSGVEPAVTPGVVTVTPKTPGEFIAFCDQQFKTVWPALLEAETRPKCQLPPYATQKLEERSISGLNMRKTAELHGLRAMALLELGRDGEAREELRGTFRIGNVAQASPGADLMQSMISAAIIALPTALIWEGLVDQHWTEPTLKALQEDLAATSPARNWAQIIECERAAQNSVYDHLISAPLPQRVADCRALLFEDADPKDPKKWLGLCPIAVFRESQLFTNQLFDSTRELIDQNGRWHPEKAAPYKVFVDDMFEHRLSTAQLPFARLMIPSMERSAHRIVITEAWLREASTAVALERYRLRHHDLPERLDQLVPEYLPSVPEDPVTGQAIRYERTSEESHRLWCEAEYQGSDLSDVVETSMLYGHKVVLWPGLAPAKPLAATAAR